MYLKPNDANVLGINELMDCTLQNLPMTTVNCAPFLLHVTTKYSNYSAVDGCLSPWNKSMFYDGSMVKTFEYTVLTVHFSMLGNVHLVGRNSEIVCNEK